MGYVLRPGLSFCVVDERPVFLDLAGDRYFGLETALGAAFVQLVRSRLGPASGAAVGALVDSGLLVATTGDVVPRPCPPPPLPEVSLLDADRVRPSSLEHLRATAHLLRVAHALKRGGLARLVTRFAQLKMRPTPPRERANATAAIADAYQRLALVTASHDKCLWRSLAIARHLAAAGVGADLVFAVRLRPFAAHCWVQADGALVNDRVETVRTFTPILVV